LSQYLSRLVRYFLKEVLRAHLVLCKCKAGELSAEEIKGVMMVLQNPRQFKVPDWFLNSKKDYIGGRLVPGRL
jgi:small subunit ribosomal protein S18e